MKEKARGKKEKKKLSPVKKSPLCFSKAGFFLGSAVFESSKSWFSLSAFLGASAAGPSLLFFSEAVNSPMLTSSSMLVFSPRTLASSMVRLVADQCLCCPLLRGNKRYNGLGVYGWPQPGGRIHRCRVGQGKYRVGGRLLLRLYGMPSLGFLIALSLLPSHHPLITFSNFIFFHSMVPHPSIFTSITLKPYKPSVNSMLLLLLNGCLISTRFHFGLMKIFCYYVEVIGCIPLWCSRSSFKKWLIECYVSFTSI